MAVQQYHNLLIPKESKTINVTELGMNRTTSRPKSVLRYLKTRIITLVLKSIIHKQVDKQRCQPRVKLCIELGLALVRQGFKFYRLSKKNTLV